MARLVTPVGGGTVRRSAERISGSWWVLVPCSFPCGFLFTLSLVVLVRSWKATKESDGPLLVGARVSGRVVHR